AMCKVFSVPPAQKAKAGDVLKVELVSRQSIVQREADALGFPGLGTLYLVEGEDKAVTRAAELFEGIGEDLPADKAAAVRQKIRDQEDDVAAGVGLIFGEGPAGPPRARAHRIPVYRLVVRPRDG